MSNQLPRWVVESSTIHPINRPEEIEAPTLKALCVCIQACADNYSAKNPKDPPLGELYYRWEIDLDTMIPQACFAYFTNKHDKPQRFMRLRLWRPQ